MLIINPYRYAAGGGGGGPLFDPNTIGSIWAWFESDSYSQADNSSISTSWTDQSSNGRDLTIGGTGMTYQTNEVNGESAIENGGSGWFSIPSMAALTAGEYFLVIKMLSTATSGGNRFSDLATSHYPFAGDGLIYDAFGSSARNDAISTSATLTNYHCVHGWSASNDWAMFQNGTSIRTNGTNTVAFSSSPRIFSNGTQIMSARAAALYLFSAKLSSGDRTSMKGRISTKYGLSIS